MFDPEPIGQNAVMMMQPLLSTATQRLSLSATPAGGNTGTDEESKHFTPNSLYSK